MTTEELKTAYEQAKEATNVAVGKSTRLESEFTAARMDVYACQSAEETALRAYAVAVGIPESCLFIIHRNPTTVTVNTGTITAGTTGLSGVA